MSLKAMVGEEVENDMIMTSYFPCRTPITPYIMSPFRLLKLDLYGPITRIYWQKNIICYLSLALRGVTVIVLSRIAPVGF
jgi:hypothetical protein